MLVLNLGQQQVTFYSITKSLCVHTQMLAVIQAIHKLFGFRGETAANQICILIPYVVHTLTQKKARQLRTLNLPLQ